MSNTTEITPNTFSVLTVSADEERGNIVVTAYSEELDAGGDLAIFFKKFDTATKKFVDDADTMAHAEETLDKLFGKSVAEVMKDTRVLNGVEFDAYLGANGDSIYANPPREFITFSKIDAKAKAAIKKLSFPVTSTPVRDARTHGVSKKGNFYSMHQIEMGLPVEVDGELKYFRISQIANPDPKGRAMSLNYRDSNRGGHKNAFGANMCDADHKLQMIADGSFDDNPALAAQMEKIATQALDSARDRLLIDVKEAYGIDLLDCEDGVEIVDIDIATVAANNSLYLIATLASE